MLPGILMGLVMELALFSSRSTLLSGFSGDHSRYTNMHIRAIAPANAEFASLQIQIRRNDGPDGTDCYVDIDDVSLDDHAYTPYVRWMEGVLPDKTVIRGNRIYEASRKRPVSGTRRMGGIVVAALPRYGLRSVKDDVTTRIFSDVEVSHNTVVRCGYTPIVVKNVHHAVVERNVIASPLISPAAAMAEMDFSEGGLDEGFDSGIYYHHTTACRTGGHLFSNEWGEKGMDWPRQCRLFPPNWKRGDLLIASCRSGSITHALVWSAVKALPRGLEAGASGK